MKYLKAIHRKLIQTIGWVAMAAACAAGQNSAQAQPAPALPPGVQDVVKLSQAGLGEDVILSQVRSAGASYNLSADQIIYLSKSGVSQTVIKALIGNNGAPTSAAPVPVPAPVTTAPPLPGAAPVAPPSPDIVASQPPATTTFDSFHDQLTPYGQWLQEPGYGLCWRPTVASLDISWRPYANAGHWIYTDAGWSWESDYPWGGIAFHYGRWTHDNFGWVWIPGYDWAPAWVCWRNSEAEGVIGWAPLPPAAVFRPGIGLEFNGGMATDVDFGLSPDAFIFIGFDHFWEHDLHPFFFPRERVDFFFHHSLVLNGYRFDHGRFFVEGIGRDRMERFSHHEVRIEVGHDFHGGFHGPERRDVHDDHRDEHRDDRRDHR